MFDELKEEKYRFQESYKVKYFKKIRRLKSLQKAEAYLEPKRIPECTFNCSLFSQ